MSYNGLGETFYTSYDAGHRHSVDVPLDGFGACGYGACGGFGGFGADRADAIGFNAATVWRDIVLGGSCYTPSSPNYQNKAMLGTCNAAGGRATKAVQAALNELGYDPGPPAGDFNAPTQAAGKQFAADMKMSYGPWLAPSKAVVYAMEDQLRKGATPGPKTPTRYKKVGTEYIKDDKIGLAALGGPVGLVAIAALGGLAYLAYKKGKRRR